jgi:Sap-like sulfolipid-1-addressing protein
MFQNTIQVILYGVLAGLSPLALAATLAVLPAGRLKALAFGSAFVIAQALTCSVFVTIGIAATGSSRGSHPDLRATLEILLALALIGLADRVRLRPPTTREGSSAWTRAMLDRLGRLHFFTTLSAGFVLGVGGPKRLLLTSLAATTIVTAGISDTGEGALVGLFVALFVALFFALATALVSGSVILDVILGGRAIAYMQDAQKAVARRQPRIAVYALLVLAALLAADAVGVLLSS